MAKRKKVETFGQLKTDVEPSEEEIVEDEGIETEGVDKRTIKLVGIFLKAMPDIPDNILIPINYAITSELMERHLHVSGLTAVLARRLQVVEKRLNISLSDNDKLYWDLEKVE